MPAAIVEGEGTIERTGEGSVKRCSIIKLMTISATKAVASNTAAPILMYDRLSFILTANLSGGSSTFLYNDSSVLGMDTPALAFLYGRTRARQL